jgi:hypothetical protein
VELEPASGAAPAPGPQSPRLLYAGKWLESFARLRSDPEKFLDRGTYIAFVAGSPFLPSGLARVRERRASTIVHGILERGER